MNASLRLASMEGARPENAIGHSPTAGKIRLALASNIIRNETSLAKATASARDDTSCVVALAIRQMKSWDDIELNNIP